MNPANPLELNLTLTLLIPPTAFEPILLAPYVKVYLMKNRKCIAKAKTAPARRTLDPLYQQQLTFREDYRQCILQVSIQYFELFCLFEFVDFHSSI